MQEALGLHGAAFQESLPAIIAWLHGERKRCSASEMQLKSCYSRLLFLLSRCSRLLTTDDDEHDSGSFDSSPCVFASSTAGAGQTGGGRTQSCKVSRNRVCLNPNLVQLLCARDLDGSNSSSTYAGGGGDAGSSCPLQEAAATAGEASSIATGAAKARRCRRKSAFGKYRC